MKEILTRLFAHEVLAQNEARTLMTGITKGEYNDAQVASLLTVFQMRGIKVEELIGFREALLDARVPVDLSDWKPIDIVGTGGDGKNTFNISTCSCFVVAGAGGHVAKHGNYGATSVSGASNVMEAHGVKFTNDESQLRKSIDESGVAYLHAPLFSPAMKGVAPVRKALKVRTVFNLLGPMINPCKPAYQLLGVANLAQMRLYTNTLQTLGVGFVIVNSLDGYDEISLTDKFKIVTNDYETICQPSDLGFETVPQSALFGGDTVEAAARIFDNVLANQAEPSQKNCVVANAAYAIQAYSGKPIEECLAMARESIESGKALAAFKKFVEINS